MDQLSGTTLLHLQLRMPGNIKRSNKDEEQDPNILKYKKIFVCKEYDELRKISQRLKNELAFVALAWPRISTLFVVPEGVSDRVQLILDYYQNHWEEAVKTFLDNYEDILQEDKNRLQDEFDENDYPSKDVLEQKIQYGYLYTKVALPDEVAMEIKNKVEKTWNTTKEMLAGVLYKGFEEIIQTIRKACDTSGNRISPLRAKTWERLQEFIDMFEARNITNDEDLSKMVAKIKSVVEGIEYEDIDITTREKLFPEFDSVLNQLLNTKSTRVVDLAEQEVED